MSDFNLEEEFGSFLDDVENYINSNVDQFLEHHGVKGMKWGKHKAKKASVELKTLGPDKIVRKTKSGEEITMSKIPPGKITKFLAKYSKGVRNSIANSASMTIRDSKGKEVGYANVEKRSKDELYLNWIGIKADSRGKGYATAVMKAAEGFGKEGGFKRMTLEVPGNSPDARHIYEKLGFKVTHEATKAEAKADIMWGGLTSMVYEFDAKHSDIDNFLAHYGVAGMKWGKRRSKAGTTHVSKRARQATKNHTKPGMSSKTKRDLIVTASLGAAMVASMALSSMSASHLSGQDAKAAKRIHEDFSDVMGLPVSSIKLSYNPSTNVWG